MAVISVRGAGGDPAARIDASPAVSLLNSLLAAGTAIRHDCGGKAICGTCAVRIVAGDAWLSPIGPREAERLSIRGLPADYRLACQARAVRDVDIEIPKDGGMPG